MVCDSQGVAHKILQHEVRLKPTLERGHERLPASVPKLPLIADTWTARGGIEVIEPVPQT